MSGSRRYTIRWTDLALEDLRTIRAYVARDDPAAARRLAGRLRAAVRRLADHPLSGRKVPEMPGSGHREIIVTPYRIVYTVLRRRAVILRVWLGSRHLGRPDAVADDEP